MSFLPKDYDKVSQGSYMKFEDGANKIRILDGPISGYEYWKDANGNIVPRGKLGGPGSTPVRVDDFAQLTPEERNGMKAFAAMTVWNYKAEQVQVLQITQSSIMNALEALATSESWGDITKYDVTINRKKTGPNAMDVEYSVMPEPHKPFDWTGKEKKTVRLQALFDGESPFDAYMDEDPISNDELDEIAKDLDSA